MPNSTQRLRRVLVVLVLLMSLALSGCASLVLAAVPVSGNDGAVVQVLGGPDFALALRADGQVVCAGSAEARACFAGWSGVSRLVLRPYSGYVFGLGQDGHILYSVGPLYSEFEAEEDEDWEEDEEGDPSAGLSSFARFPEDEAFWSGLVDVAAVYAYGGLFTVGLRADGTAVAMLTYPEEESEMDFDADVEEEPFLGESFFSSGEEFSVDVSMDDGEEEGEGDEEDDDEDDWGGGYLDVSGWQGVAQLVHNGRELFGLTADGRVLSCFYNETPGQQMSKDGRKSFSRIDAPKVRALYPVPYRDVLALCEDGSVFIPVWRDVNAAARLIPPKSFGGIETLAVSRSEDYLVCYGLCSDGRVEIWDLDFDSRGDDMFPKGKYEGGYSLDSPSVKTWKKMKARIESWREVRSLYVIPRFDEIVPIAVFADGSSSSAFALPWTDIETLCGNGSVLIALRRGGRVGVLSDDDGWELPESWSDITSLCFSDFPAQRDGATLYGLTADGRIRTAGDNRFGQCDFPQEYMA